MHVSLSRAERAGRDRERSRAKCRWRAGIRNAEYELAECHMFQSENVLEDRPLRLDEPDRVFRDDTEPYAPPAPSSGIAVIISTRGRPEIIQALVQELPMQTLPPEHIFVIASNADDVARIDR